MTEVRLRALWVRWGCGRGRWAGYAAWRAALGPPPPRVAGVRLWVREVDGRPVWAQEPVGVEFAGRRQSLRRWEEEFGWRPGLIRSRLRAGWTVAEALSTPPRSYRKRPSEAEVRRATEDN